VNAPRRLTRVLAEREAGQRLDALLGAWLPEALSAVGTDGLTLSKSAIRRLIMAGAVRVGGRPLRRPGFVVSAGDSIEVRVQPERLLPPRDAPFAIGPAQVLFEDDWLIAVDKPAGIATVPTADPSRPHVVGAVAAYLKSEYVGVHQRLDRETSGVVLFTKDPAANPAVSRAFAAHEVRKTYHALVRSAAAAKARRAKAPAPSTWVNRDPVGGQAAETAFAVLERLRDALLVEAEPRTGRKHQIRIHLAAARLPIVGDERYGGPRASRLMLHAVRLVLPHPRTALELRIESAYPADFRRVLQDFE
jgi:23S rRNA pseudouridine1911/1915/1917 synthase